jgi:hypothetical protein
MIRVNASEPAAVIAGEEPFTDTLLLEAVEPPERF